MSSSGEEIDLDDLNDVDHDVNEAQHTDHGIDEATQAGHGRKKTPRKNKSVSSHLTDPPNGGPTLDHYFGGMDQWDEKLVWKLATYVFSKMTADAFTSPYNTVNVDWEKVEEVVGVEEAKCKEKWSSLLNSVRQYRTLPEIITDILTKKSVPHGANEKAKGVKKLVVKKKKVKRKINPDHPKRPRVSGYAVYFSEIYDKLAEKGQKGVSLMFTVGEMWKDLTESERARYNEEWHKEKDEYFKSVQEYAEQHPEDEEIQKILAEVLSRKTRKRSAKVRVKRKGSDEELADVSMNEDMNLTMNTDATEDSSQNKSPKKKRKKQDVKYWSAEDSFLEAKYDDYKEEHPDMSDEEVKQKIMKKFKKLSEKKLEKYKKMADEKNR